MSVQLRNILREVKRLNARLDKLKCSGFIPSYTQAEIDEWTPECNSLVYNETTGALNYWNGTTWVVVQNV